MSVTVTLGMTTWNQGMSVLPYTLAALRSERDLLVRSGYESRLLVLDNQSTDGTEDYLSTQRGMVVSQQPVSVGVSSLRNFLVESARRMDSDYVAFIDGDIGVVPHSLVAMVRYLDTHLAIAAVGMDPLNQVQTWGESSSYCGSVKNTRTDALMYLCGYGVFRREVFESIQFDESGPFAGPGWGSEDDDLYLQMVEARMQTAYVEGHAFYHGTPRSSWPSLRALGIDPLQSFETRRDYLLQKWRSHQPQHVHSGHLNLLKGQKVYA